MIKIPALSALLIMSLFVLSCGNDDLPASRTIDPIDTKYFFEGNIDGLPISYDDEDTPPRSYEETISGSNSCDVSYWAYLGGLFSQKSILYVNFRSIYSSNAPCDTENDIKPVFNTFFQEGSYDYSSFTGPIRPSQIAIEYVDENDLRWSSAGGEQSTAHNFAVTSSEDLGLDELGNPQQKVSGTINCMLYDAEGNAIELRNGTFTYKFTFQ